MYESIKLTQLGRWYVNQCQSPHLDVCKPTHTHTNEEVFILCLRSSTARSGQLVQSRTSMRTTVTNIAVLSRHGIETNYVKSVPDAKVTRKTFINCYEFTQSVKHSFHSSVHMHPSLASYLGLLWQAAQLLSHKRVIVYNNRNNIYSELAEVLPQSYIYYVNNFRNILISVAFCDPI